jgi:hypothetical protein
MLEMRKPRDPSRHANVPDRQERMQTPGCRQPKLTEREGNVRHPKGALFARSGSIMRSSKELHPPVKADPPGGLYNAVTAELDLAIRAGQVID